MAPAPASDTACGPASHARNNTASALNVLAKLALARAVKERKALLTLYICAVFVTYLPFFRLSSQKRRSVFFVLVHGRMFSSMRESLAVRAKSTRVG